MPARMIAPTRRAGRSQETLNICRIRAMSVRLRSPSAVRLDPAHTIIGHELPRALPDLMLNAN